MRRVLLIPARAALPFALSLTLLAPVQASGVTKAAQMAASPQELVLHLRAQPGDRQRQTLSMQMQTAMLMTNMLPPPDASERERAQMAERMKATPKSLRMDTRSVLRIEASEADAKGDFLLHLRGEGGSMQLSTGDKDGKPIPLPQADIEIDALLSTRHADVQLLRTKGGHQTLQDPRLVQRLAENLIKQASGAAAGLEGRRMKVGDSAEIPFDLQMPVYQLPAGSQFSSMLTLTLRSIQKGIAHFDTALTIQMALPAKEATPTPIILNMSGSGQGRLDYRIADRVTLNQQLDMEILMSMRAPSSSDMQISTQMQMRARGEALR